MAQKLLAIGSGAGFAGDRWDAAGPVVDTLIARGGPAGLVYETLGERTLALAQLARRAHPEGGYEPTLDRFVGPVLARCVNHRIPIIGNFGAANAQGAARPYVSANAYLGAMNFVLDGNLDGGVNDSINLDTHGKSLAFMLLALELRVPAALIAPS